MQVKVGYFALFREQAGCQSEALEWTGGTARDLFVWVATIHPALTAETAALVAVNDEMVNWATKIKAGDEVLFFPPVAGG